MDSTKRIAVTLSEGEWKLKESEIPKPPAGKILVRVAYSTVNPHDRYAHLAYKEEGKVNGVDGCGTIIEVGEGVDQSLVGKKVAFGYGAWQTHTITDPNFVIYLDDSQDLTKAACAFANPLTVANQLDVAKKAGAKAVIALAGASALSKMFLKLADKEGIQTILIVRKDEHVQHLKEEHQAKYVLNSASETFNDDLTKVIKELNPTILFEYLGGDQPSKVFEKMPPGSELVVVGNLTTSPLQLNSGDILFNNKRVSGLYVTRWLFEISAEEKRKWQDLISQDLKEGGKIFGTTFVKTRPVSEWKEAIEESETIATNGKILLDCQ